MSDVDVRKLSFSELVALRAKLDRQIVDKRDEELKVLADGYAKKLQQAGFSIAEGIEALRPYAGAKRVTKDSSSGVAAPVLYQDPSNPSNTWSGRGRPARWLADYEAAGRNRDEFKVSGR